MKIHILEKNNFSYKIVIHFPVPTGKNSVGKTWKSVALASGKIGSTSLKVGTKPSNITQEEYDDIIAGDVIEIIRSIEAEETAIEKMADIFINEYKENMSNVLRYYGHII